MNKPDIKKWLTSILLIMLPLFANASFPKCDGIENWPASMAFVQLINQNILTNSQVDFKKSKVKLLASQELTKNIYTQVHEVQFLRTDGSHIRVITENRASVFECSEGPVKVYLVSQIFGG